MSLLGIILVIFLFVILLGGVSGVGGVSYGYGLGHGGIGIVGILLIVLLILVLTGRL